jgi:hypothetical protein
VRAISPLLATAELPSQPVVLQRQSLLLDVMAFGDEVCRRRAVGLGGLNDRELLRILFELPADLEVPRSVLSARDQRRLRGAPAGAVDIARHSVTRLAVPPIRVVVARAVRVPSIAAVRSVSQFGSFCATELVSTRREVPVETVDEARRLSVSVRGVDGSAIYSAPPFKIERHTPAMWLFLERVFASLDV